MFRYNYNDCPIYVLTNLRGYEKEYNIIVNDKLIKNITIDEINDYVFYIDNNRFIIKYHSGGNIAWSENFYSYNLKTEYEDIISFEWEKTYDEDFDTETLKQHHADIEKYQSELTLLEEPELEILRLYPHDFYSLLELEAAIVDFIT